MEHYDLKLKQTTGLDDRALWVDLLFKISRPVLTTLAERRLRTVMPVEGKGDERFDRTHFSHLEALGRTLAGIAP